MLFIENVRRRPRESPGPLAFRFCLAVPEYRSTRRWLGGSAMTRSTAPIQSETERAAVLPARVSVSCKRIGHKRIPGPGTRLGEQ